MKRFINNKLVEMTPEEIEEYNNQQQVQPTQEPTIEERIANVEEVILNLL